VKIGKKLKLFSKHFSKEGKKNQIAANQYAKIMNIQVLGTGCPKCKSLEKATREVITQYNIDATITKVADIVEIMKFNIMTTPALVVDGKVVVKGRVPSNEELKQILTNKIYMI
jgi:small redox-active disulfide protein 2